MPHNPTPAERKLWYEYLRNMSVRVLRQKPIERFIVDFYCASVKLAIEVDSVNGRNSPKSPLESYPLPTDSQTEDPERSRGQERGQGETGTAEDP